jgi:hypothetical protein
MTHEFTIVGLDPAIKINFHRNLWHQSKLSPILPVMIGFQFHAASDAAAAERIQLLVDMVMRQEFPPYIQSEWLPHFRDGLDITTPLLDMDSLDQIAAPVAPGCIDCGAALVRQAQYADHVRAFRSQAKPNRLWRWAKPALYATTIGCLSIVVTSLGTPRRQIPAGQWHEEGHGVFDRELVMEDGAVRHVRLSPVVGFPGRYSVQLLAKHPLTIQPHKEKPESLLLGGSAVAAQAHNLNDEDEAGGHDQQ